MHEGARRARRQRHDRPGRQRRPEGAAARDRPRHGAHRRTSSRPATTSCSRTATARRSATCSSRTSSPAHVVPPVPLDWCGAQTQGTIGFTILDTLEWSLAARGVDRRCAALVTRTLVDADDPGFTNPTKPIGRFLPHEQAKVLIEHGQTWEDRGEKGWRRVVASPSRSRSSRPTRCSPSCEAGYVVVAAGGGGIPVIRTPEGKIHGIEAVIDKDLTAAVLARAVRADVLVIATDVENAIVGYGTPRPSRSGGSPSPRWRRMPRRATSRPAPWGRRSRPRCGSCAAGASAASSPPSTASPRPSTSADGSIGTVIEGDSPDRAAAANPCTRTTTCPPRKDDRPCPNPLRSARSRSTASPTPPSSRSSSTTGSWRPAASSPSSARPRATAASTTTPASSPTAPSARSWSPRAPPRSRSSRSRSCGPAAPTVSSAPTPRSSRPSPRRRPRSPMTCG